MIFICVMMTIGDDDIGDDEKEEEEEEEEEINIGDGLGEDAMNLKGYLANSHKEWYE